MNKPLRFLAPVFAGLVSLAVAQTTTPPASTAAPAPAAAAPATPPAPLDPTIAAFRPNNARFVQFHESFLKRGKEGPIGVLFLGDSITEGWRSVPHIWEHYFGKYQPANFGYSGDQTQNVIWRLENGELEGITPKVVVLMIGTNNSGQHTGDQIVDGIKKIIEITRAKIPGVKFLLLAIFPRDSRRNRDGLITEAEITDTGRRVAANNRANELLARLDDGANIRFLNINPVFLGKDGRIPWTIMPDQLHLTPAGYQLWADAIDKPLAEMMK
jgi:lysophospholipase L1-like esterase